MMHHQIQGMGSAVIAPIHTMIVKKVIICNTNLQSLYIHYTPFFPSLLWGVVVCDRKIDEQSM